MENILKANAFTKAFLVASLIEEGIKFIVLAIAINKINNTDTYKSILIAVGISLGVATSENIIFVINGGVDTAIVRAFFAIPLHACCGFLMGYWLTRGSYFAAFITAFLIHGFYDYFLFAQDIPFFIAFVFIGLVSWVVIESLYVVLAFHHSNKEKVKFSWGNSMFKPGKGEIHTIDSFNDGYLFNIMLFLLAFCIGILIFFHTGLGDFLINIIDNIRINVIKILGG